MMLGKRSFATAISGLFGKILVSFGRALRMLKVGVGATLVVLALLLVF